MKRYVSYGPGGIEVVYVPGESPLSVTNEDHSLPEPRGYISDREIPSHRVTETRFTAWERRGILAAFLALAIGLIVDGGTLLLLAWIS